MIYTITFNPALDYVVHVERFALGGVNRAVHESMFYGGKGINVSAILSALGFENTALGFVAGFTGAEIERGVKTLGFESDFIRVRNGMSRINVKLKSDQESEINGMGPEILTADVEKLFQKLEKLEAGDILVLSGSIPQSVSSRIYEDIMGRLSGKGIRIVVDATKDLLMEVLHYRPFLIKPNNHELGELFGVRLQTDDEIVRYARLLQEKGACNVLVSMAGDGAILLTEDGRVLRRRPPQGKVRNSVGAGDSMVAGFLAGYLRTGTYEEALKLGTAAGSASAFSEGLADGDTIMSVYQSLPESLVSGSAEHGI